MLTDKHFVLRESCAERTIVIGAAGECSSKGHQETTLQGVQPAGAFVGPTEDEHHLNSWELGDQVG